MANHSLMKLGKKPARRDSRTLRLARYLLPGLPPAPAQVDWTRGVPDWGMMLNDRLGCCTIAAVGHAVQAWTLAALGREITVPDSSILQYYEQWDGYDPADPSTDQGGVELDVLNDWRQQRFAGVSLDAYAVIHEVANGELMQIDPAMMRAAMWLCGGAYIGVELPIRAQDQDVWDVVPNPVATDVAGSWGGHAIYLAAYDADTLTCVTWGQLKKMTWSWFEAYCSEAYALVSADWIKASGLAPSGFDLAALEADLKLVTA